MRSVGRLRMLEIAFGAWAMVSVYAVAHDQYIVRIAPEHFTLYHRSIPGVTSAPVQAAILAFLAAIVPGFALGIGLALAAQAGPGPRVGVRRALWGVARVIALSEVLSAAAGVAAGVRGEPLYGHERFFVPDMPVALIVTQTIQITCYAVSAAASGGLILAVLARRWRGADDLTSTSDSRTGSCW